MDVESNILKFETVSKIHNNIINNIRKDKDKLPALQKHLEKCKKEFEESFDDDIKRDLQKKILKIKRIMDNYSNDIDLSMYRLKANTRFKQYNKVINAPKKQLSKKEKEMYNNTLRNIHGLFTQYVDDIDMSLTKIKEKIICSVCREVLNDSIHKKDDHYECRCGNIIRTIDIINPYDNNIKKSQSNDYDKEKTFRIKLNNFEGKCVKDIPPGWLMDDIKLFYRRKKYIDIHDIQKYLKEHDGTIYYEAKYFILYYVTGMKPYDLTNEKEEICMWYKKIQNWNKDKYDKFIIDKALLYFFIRRFKPKVKKRHIYFLKTPEKQMEYLYKWENITKIFPYLKIKKKEYF